MHSLLPSLIAVIAGLAFLLLPGCASKNKVPDVSFRPIENEARTRDGKPQAAYMIPGPSSPTGRANIVYQGIENVRTKSSANKVPSIHLKMIVTNEVSEAPWNIDVRAQELSFKNETKAIKPTWAHVEGGSLPEVSVKINNQKTIDLYYALPEGKTAGDIPGFTLNWEIRTPGRVVAQATPFDQIFGVGRNVATYPFSDRPFDYDPYLRPFGTESRDAASLGIKSDWWMDPLTDVPPPWNEMDQQQY